MPVSNYNDLELRHLRYFIAVAEELHFGRAAKRLFITQPTLSRQIKEMEEVAGVLLFERTKRKVELTQAGEFFYNEVLELFEHLDQLIKEAKQIEQGYTGKLKISFTSASLNFMVSSLLEKFNRQNRKVRIDFTEAASSEQLKLVLDKQVDVAFHHQPKVPESLTSLLLGTEKLGVALPAKHRLKNKNSITLEQLEDESWILFPKAINPYFHESIVQAFHKTGYTPDVVYEISPRQDAVSLVSASFGITFLSPSLEHYCTEKNDVIFKNLEGESPKIDYYCSWNPENATPVATNFIGLL